MDGFEVRDEDLGLIFDWPGSRTINIRDINTREEVDVRSFGYRSDDARPTPDEALRMIDEIRKELAETDDINE